MNFLDKTARQIFEEEADGKPMREPGKIKVSFTPRVFPTAARESTAREEEEVHVWQLRKFQLIIFTQEMANIVVSNL